tara:strand:+ start:5977 stop:6153 length:177 start_codon:yes stop_codon:yes gene_type:complete
MISFHNSTVEDRGLGDTLARGFKALGIKKLADKYTEVTGKDCGCSKRQEKLNKIIPYK